MSLTGGLGIALLLALLTAGAGWKHAISVQEQFDAFKLTQASLARQQQKVIAAEKAQHEADVHTAIADRDAALKRLRERAEHSNADRVRTVPAAAAGTDKLCFKRAELDSAVQRLLGDFQAVAQDGDAAVIDNRAWFEAWPK